MGSREWGFAPRDFGKRSYQAAFRELFWRCGARSLVLGLGLLSLLAALLVVPLTACGGCPRRRSSGEGEADGSTAQAVRAHETADHVVVVDTPLVIVDEHGSVAPAPLDPEAVHRVIAAELADVRRCYERARTEHPELAGRLVLELHITADGVVRAAEVSESTLDEALVTDCVASEARLWHFPSSAQGAHVRYPFELRPGPEPTLDAASPAPGG